MADRKIYLGTAPEKRKEGYKLSPYIYRGSTLMINTNVNETTLREWTKSAAKIDDDTDSKIKGTVGTPLIITPVPVNAKINDIYIKIYGAKDNIYDSQNTFGSVFRFNIGFWGKNKKRQRYTGNDAVDSTASSDEWKYRSQMPDAYKPIISNLIENINVNDYISWNEYWHHVPHNTDRHLRLFLKDVATEAYKEFEKDQEVYLGFELTKAQEDSGGFVAPDTVTGLTLKMSFVELTTSEMPNEEEVYGRK